MTKRALLLTPLAALVLAVGCGGSSHPAKLAAQCSTPIGKGTPGACAPAAEKKAADKPTLIHGTTFPDLSNNDPVYNMAPIAKAGHPAVWLKVNEGTGYVDRTFAPMVTAARKAGLAPGGYDFVRNYNAAEANLFVSRLKATGTCGNKTTLPPTLDIEAGNASRSGVQTMVDIVKKACGSVTIYTGLWYWSPHLGSWWPSGVYAWISGYPNIVGSASYSQVSVHQYTDKGWNGAINSDMNVWLGKGSLAAFANDVAAPAPKPKPVIPSWAGKGHRYPFHSRRGWYRVVLVPHGHNHGRWHYYGSRDLPKIKV